MIYTLYMNLTKQENISEKSIDYMNNTCYNMNRNSVLRKLRSSYVWFIPAQATFFPLLKTLAYIKRIPKKNYTLRTFRFPFFCEHRFLTVFVLFPYCTHFRASFAESFLQSFPNKVFLFGNIHIFSFVFCSLSDFPQSFPQSRFCVSMRTSSFQVLTKFCRKSAHFCASSRRSLS